MGESTHELLALVVAMVLSLGIAACTAESGDDAAESAGEQASPEGVGELARSDEADEHASSEGAGEHDEGGEGHESASEREGEESGERIGREDTWDATRNGARLVLAFDPASAAFVGTVENTTRQTLCAVRVEVHLSTGTELGPTERTDLQPGATTALRWSTAGEAFESWTAHPELSACSGG